VTGKKEIVVKEELQTDENVVHKTKITNVLEQNAALKELLKQESNKIETFKSGLVNLQHKLLKEKKEKKVLASKIKTHTKKICDLYQKSLEFEQTIQNQ
jgi:Na+-translocating ferredoxin:NAD+ oxidoreductase RnfG subunit